MSSYGLGVVAAENHAAAADIVAGENGHDLFIPRLPGERIGALTAARLDGLHLDIGPRTMRLHSDSSDARPAAVLRRLRDTWLRIMDGCEIMWPAGRLVRIQLAGPWSLAAGIELFDGHRALTDRGARRDIADALAEAIGDYVRDITRRFAGEVHLQIDEPLLPAVMAGKLSGVHQWDTISAIPVPDAALLLARTVAPQRAAVSSISLNVAGEKFGPQQQAALWPLLHGLRGTEAQVDAVLLPKRVLVGAENLDGVGQLVSEGTRLGLGIGLGTSADITDGAREVAISVARLWDQLSLRRDSLVTDVDLTPDGDLLPGGDLPDGSVRPSPAERLRLLRTASDMLTRDAGDL